MQNIPLSASQPGPLARVQPAPPHLSAWRLVTLAGRLVEVSGDPAGASLTLVFQLMLDAQRQGEPVAWISQSQSPFFPPDIAEVGLDLAALPVVWAPDAIAAARAADLLVRSGAFCLVALDLGAKTSLSIAIQARLAGLAKHHHTAIICITESKSHRPSLGSLVSLRAHTMRGAREANGFRCEARILKDKRHGPGWCHVEVCRGPDGLH